jgi:pimeloyl-ACP methyl ester carboxylesterase
MGKTFMKTDNVLTLPDGRKLAYAEFGLPDGYPVLYFHGSPASRLEPLILGDEIFSQFGLRAIAPDRPGIGRSDFQTNRGFSDWPNDVAFLADALRLDQFSMLGNSGGGGYAAVCAAKIPDRLRSAVITSGSWRMDWPESLNNLSGPHRLTWNIASKAPFLLPLMLRFAKRMTLPQEDDRGRERMLAQQKRALHGSDYAVLAQPGRLDAFLLMFSEVFNQGYKGPAWDMRLYVREWDFLLNEIRIPLKVFHGEQDMNVPLALVQKVLSSLPRAQLTTYLPTQMKRIYRLSSTISVKLQKHSIVSRFDQPT